MIRPAYLAFIMLLSQLASCTTIKQLNSDFAELTLGGPFSKERFELRGNQIRRLQLDSANRVQNKKSRRLSEQEVVNFWAELKAQDISSWLPEYKLSKPDGRPDCGYCDWHIHAQRDGQVVQSGGGGAFPQDENPKRTKNYDSSARFDRVYDTFDQLAPKLSTQ